MITYFVVDYETNGTDVCSCSALTLACVAFRGANIVSAFSRNVIPKPDSGDAETMEWWKRFPHQYKRATENARPASKVLEEFAGWVDWCLNGKTTTAVLCASPMAFDVPILRRYWRYIEPGPWPFGHRPLDVRSYVAAKQRVPFDGVVWRADLFEKNMGVPPVQHVALDDALVTAYTLMDALRGCATPKDEAAI